jgi:hypothetical protein
MQWISLIHRKKIFPSSDKYLKTLRRLNVLSMILLMRRKKR